MPCRVGQVWDAGDGRHRAAQDVGGKKVRVDEVDAARSQDGDQMRERPEVELPPGHVEDVEVFRGCPCASRVLVNSPKKGAATSAR